MTNIDTIFYMKKLFILIYNILSDYSFLAKKCVKMTLIICRLLNNY